MSDTGQQWLEQRKMSANKFPGILYVSSSFAISWAGIGGIVIWGDKTNNLHSSAMSWMFVVILATIAAYGLTSITEIVKNRTDKS